MRTFKSYGDLADAFLGVAVKHQQEIAQLTETIKDEFLGKIRDLVYAKTSSWVAEARKAGGNPISQFLETWPDERSRDAAALYPNVLLSSLFVSSYFSFEHELTALCRQLAQIGAYAVEIDDFKDKGITRARAYLHKVAGIKIPEDDADWRYLQQLGALRNLISHNGGYLKGPDDRSDAANFVRSHKHLSTNEEHWVIVTPEFIVEVAEKLEWVGIDIYKVLLTRDSDFIPDPTAAAS